MDNYLRWVHSCKR